MARALTAVTLIMVVTQYVVRGKQKKMAGTSKQLSLCTESSNGRNVAHLLYGFDTENPWKHFTGAQAPLSSSVERGTKKQSTKLKKIYLKRKEQSPPERIGLMQT